MPEERTIISSKSDIDPCTPDQDIDPTKKCGQTDGWMAFQLYSRCMYMVIFSQSVLDY